jgi:hypothetical protein
VVGLGLQAVKTETGAYIVNQQGVVNRATVEAMARGGVDKMLADREDRSHNEDTLVDRYATSLMGCTETEVRAALTIAASR